MMPEHDPQPGRGSGPPDEGSGRAAHDHADDEVVQMSSRRGAAPAETDDTVVDLRPRDALLASDALPTSDEPLAPDPGSEAPVERRSPEVAAIPSGASGLSLPLLSATAARWLPTPTTCAPSACHER